MVSRRLIAAAPMLLWIVAVSTPTSPARAQALPIAVDPAWESGPANFTRAVALGDIDRDGRLDLVCGTLSAANTLFPGTSRFFSANSAWSPAVSSTAAIVLGDVDGDGDLDVVCGNVGGRTVYTNDAGSLGAAPSQSIPGATTTFGVALADVDGDGDLDLVCANDVAGVSLFRNAGGVFETPAAWSSATGQVRAVALGDVDGDGVLDLVCGNLGANTLYRGSGGVFESTPGWASDSTLATNAVRLGDVDGDGALDLVCASEEHATMYRNVAAALETAPAWVASPGVAVALDLGDIDLDGDLDVVFGLTGAGDVAYRNDGGTFGAAPAWTAARASDTGAVALADADGDGDLDVVCANSLETNTVYENLAPPLPAAPDWTAGTAPQTYAIDTGDVTGDGRPDLVCGNLGMNVLFAGGGAPFGSVPSWQSLASVLTPAVALGDLDGDGDLDVVFGNVGPNTAYTTTGGVPGLTPSWTSSVSNIASDIALGDVDRDGDLDLVCADAGGNNTLYRNLGAVLATAPVWTAAGAAASGVALADLDGDGDLDAVFSNTDFAKNTMYRYEGGTFAAAPAWSSGPANTSSSVALGDVDGDGARDAVFGNVSQPNTLYLNSGGVFATDPAWSSGPSQATSSVALGDVDGDGDLDLVCGNLSQPDELYVNDGGTFMASPRWTSAASAETEDVVLADVDGDGDLDLVCGNELSPNTAYLGLRNPPYRHDVAAPTHQTPNLTAWIASPAVAAPSTNHRAVRFTMVDAEGDPVWVVAEYQFEGEPVWMRADTGTNGLAGPFASSAAGTVDSLDWDVTRIAFDARPVTLRLRAVEVPARVSAVHSIAQVTLALGRITPARPEIHTDVASVDFGTVTQGDTASATIAVDNRGTVDLVVDGVTLPSAEMRSDAALPMVITPGASRAIGVFLEPVTESSLAGSITISSNDVVTPVAAVDVSADIRALAATTRLLTAAPAIALGEAVTVIVEPLPQVHVEGGSLYHRAAGAVSFDRIALGRSGNDFIGVIPGASVVESGIEYYVEVRNDPVVSTDPPGAPADSVFSQAVESPSSVAATPRPTAGEDFAEAADIRVDVHMPQGAEFVAGSLFYRKGGAEPFDPAPLVLDGGTPAAMIPAEMVGPRGVEYYVAVDTRTASVTDPAVDPAARPRTIRVSVPNLVEPGAHAGESYRLFSVPLDMQGSILGSLADELGGKDNTQWRLFGYDADAGRYRELPDADETRFTLGRGYWLITRDEHRIGTGADVGLSTPTGAPFAVTLAPGYNLVGTPFDFTVAWDSCFVDTLAVADTLASAIVEPPVAWLPRVGYAYDVATMKPFDAYWVKNRTAADVVLKIPPRALPEPVPAPAPLAATRTDDGWRLTVRAAVADGDVVSMPAVLGVEPSAADGADGLDRALPPLPPGRAIAVYAAHGAGETRARDLLAAAGGGYVWSVDIAKSYADEKGGDDVAVGVEGIDALPAALSAVLVDRALGRVADLRERPSLRAIVGERKATATEANARFALVVGSAEFVAARAGELAPPPARTALLQNHPNPFNPRTVIRYDLDRPARVSLRIYDVRGALVRVLDERDRPAGRYEVGWDGTDDRGARVASGVYFYRLTAGSFTATRKMVLLK